MSEYGIIIGETGTGFSDNLLNFCFSKFLADSLQLPFKILWNNSLSALPIKGSFRIDVPPANMKSLSPHDIFDLASKNNWGHLSKDTSYLWNNYPKFWPYTTKDPTFNFFGSSFENAMHKLKEDAWYFIEHILDLPTTSQRQSHNCSQVDRPLVVFHFRFGDHVLTNRHSWTKHKDEVESFLRIALQHLSDFSPSDPYSVLFLSDGNQQELAEFLKTLDSKLPVVTPDGKPTHPIYQEIAESDWEKNISDFLSIAHAARLYSSSNSNFSLLASRMASLRNKEFEHFHIISGKVVPYNENEFQKTITSPYWNYVPQKNKKIETFSQEIYGKKPLPMGSSLRSYIPLLKENLLIVRNHLQKTINMISKKLK